MIIPAQEIRRRCDPVDGTLKVRHPLISPFSERYKVAALDYTLSGGLGPAGYDVAVEFDEVGETQTFVLSPGQFLLASTIERFDMPLDLVGKVHDKSTLARLGIAVQNTVIEPGWRGYLTLEITNHGPRPVSLMRGLPIAQVLFELLSEPTDWVYPEEGKYQDQRRGPVGAR